MDTLRQRLRALVLEELPVTVRQVFYRASTAGLVEKSEREYKNAICRLLADMRLSDEVPFAAIADNTRWMRKPTTHSSAEAALREVAAFYRRRLWDNQDAHVEIWLEKDALAGVVYEITDEFDVPLMVTRGYASLSYLYDAAHAFRAVGKPVFIYYFGDYDPSGLDIGGNVDRRLRQFAGPETKVHFERVAVSAEQIERFGLPTRPTKRSDSRSATFKGDSVELDAIPPGQLRDLVRACIERHIDGRALAITREIEASERVSLRLVAEGLR